MKIINKLPKYLLFVQAIPYFCMLLEMLELILESNLFNLNITANISTLIWCFYCEHCVHIVGITAVISSVAALIINFKEKAARKKYIIYTLVHILMAWFTYVWFNALMSV